MGDPQRIGWGKVSVEEEQAEQDRLLARIEDEGLISGWCWGPMTDTLGMLRELPDTVAWVGTRYLQSVVVQGDRLFGAPEHYQMSLDEERSRPGLRCRCGEVADADRSVKRHGREVVVAVCGSCGITSVQYDREPYPHKTLLSQGFH